MIIMRYILTKHNHQETKESILLMVTKLLTVISNHNVFYQFVGILESTYIISIDKLSIYCKFNEINKSMYQNNLCDLNTIHYNKQIKYNILFWYLLLILLSLVYMVYCDMIIVKN
eukprot:79422_1